MSTNVFAQEPVRSSTLETLALERHYTIAEIASMWSLSGKTVRRMFQDESGVLKWSVPEGRHKRGYITMRVPQSVLLRVHCKRTQGTI